MEHSNAFVAIICLPINYFLKNAPSEMYGIALNTHLNSFYFTQLIVLLQYEYTARQKLFNCYIMKTFNTQRKSRDKRCIKLKKKNYSSTVSLYLM